MTENIVVAPPKKAAGLNNKKMVIHGMRIIANRKGYSYTIPDDEFDFTPTKSGNGDVFIPSRDVFNRDVLESFFNDAVKEGPNLRLSNTECLEASTLVMKSEVHRSDLARNETAATFAAFEPAPALKKIAGKLSAKLPAQVCGLQLRIERDWIEHVSRKGWVDGQIVNGSEIVLDHKKIFSKIEQTEILPKQIFVCCDEDDLLISKSDLERDAKKFGLSLIFKSQILENIESRLKKSVIDFEICLNLPYYVGLSLSTYSNILCMVAGYNTNKEPEHYLFNAKGDRCLRRRDFGRSSSASAATIST